MSAPAASFCSELSPNLTRSPRLSCPHSSTRPPLKRWLLSSKISARQRPSCRRIATVTRCVLSTVLVSFGEDQPTLPCRSGHSSCARQSSRLTLARHSDRSPRSRLWHRKLRRRLSREGHACVFLKIRTDSGRKGGSLRCEQWGFFVQSSASRQYHVVAVKQCRSTYIHRSPSRRRVCLSVWLVPSLRLLMYVISRSR